MSRHGRRRRAVVLLPAGAIAAVGSVETWSARGWFPTLRTLEEPITGSTILASALLVVGVIPLWAAALALANRPVTPRFAAAIPVVATIGAALFGIRTGIIAMTASVPAVTPIGTFVLTVALAGTAVAPIVVATTREYTSVLLAGTVVLLAGIFSSPAPVLTALVGVGAGIAAVGTLWIVDASAWRP